MRNEREKYNDSLLIWDWLGSFIVGTIVFMLPVILWYLSKFITFIQNEDLKELVIYFLIGFSTLPLFLFITRDKNKKRKEKEDFYM